MSNVATVFKDPADLYTGGYTSEVLEPVFANSSSNNTRGTIQVDITSGTVELQMRLTKDAPWFTAKIYSTSIVEEVVLANYMQLIVSADAKCWLGETR